MKQNLKTKDIRKALREYFKEHGTWLTTSTDNRHKSIQIGDRFYTVMTLSKNLKEGRVLSDSGVLEKSSLPVTTDSLKAEWVACQTIPVIMGAENIAPIKTQDTDLALRDVKKSLMSFFRRNGEWPNTTSRLKRVSLKIDDHNTILVGDLAMIIRSARRGLPKGHTLKSIVDELRADIAKEVKATQRISTLHTPVYI